ncbi:MAG: MoaD/ThiS family protein [Acidilobus sp.]
MALRLAVLLGGAVAEAAGVHREELELPEGSRLSDVIAELVRRHGPRLEAALRGRVLILVNGRGAAPGSADDRPLSDGDFISILPPISGGSEMPMLLDTSAIVKYMAGEEGWERVGQVMRGSYTLDVAIVEAANALARRVRSAKLSMEAALRALGSLLDGSDGLKVLGFRDFIGRALELSSGEDITVQDALFIAAAVSVGAELVTADSRQAEVAARHGVPVMVV